MADQIQLRGGTTAEHSTFTGAAREVTVDTDKDTLVVHDGATAGGKPLLNEADLKGKNLLINGDFQVWQRGDSHTPTVSSEYYADRWRNATASSGETRQIRDAGLGYGYRIVGSSTTAFYQLSQRVELNYALREELSNNTYTCSFVGDLPDVTDSYRVYVSIEHTGGTEVVGYVPIVQVGNKYTATIDFPDLGSLILDDTSYLNLAINNNISPAPDGNYDIYQVKLEKGEVATPFEYESYGDVLAKCQRYYYSNDLYNFPVSRVTTGATLFGGTVEFPVTMRANPTVTYGAYDPGALSGSPALGNIAGSWSTFSARKNWVQPSLVLVSNSSAVTGMVQLEDFTADAEL